MNKVCCIKGCKKPIKVYSMCSRHAERMRLYKNPLRKNVYILKHGLTHDPIYKIWSGAKNRCSNPNNVSYKNYGGRGIKMSKEFLDPVTFVEYVKKLKDFSLRKEKKLTLDRIDNNKGYERGNLRWATKTMQSLNKGLSPRNTSGYNGVSYSPSYRGKKKYVAYTKKYGKHIHLGWFKTAKEGNEAIIKYKNKNG